MKFASLVGWISWLVLPFAVCSAASSSDAGAEPAETKVLEGIGASRATGSMSTVRSQHTMTWLLSGEVLAVGGIDEEGSVLGSAEVFDPATGEWTSAGSLLQARHGHTASLLPSGQVLVAGGEDQLTVLDSAEIFDPRTGAWSAAPGSELLTPRSGHSATVLRRGEVLISGGSGSGGPLASAEIYEPDVERWRPAAAMASPREGHTATLLLPSDRVLVCGGSDGSGFPAGAEVYDPAADSWTATGAEMTTRRSRHTATLLPDGGVLVVGGLNAAGSVIAEVELFDPETGQWATAGQIGGRHSHRATLLPSGQVLISGGLDGMAGEAGVELYDTEIGWAAAGELMAARHNHAAILLPSGAVLIAGGDLEASAEIYELATASWTPASGRRTAAPTPTVTPLPSGKLLASGAISYVGRTAEIFDPEANVWELTPRPQCFRVEGAASLLLPSGEALVVGGVFNTSLGAALTCVEIYDPNLGGGAWRAVGHMNVARGWHSITLLPSGEVLAVGGGRAGSELRSAEVYDPESETWTMLAGELGEARFGHTATLLMTGEVLVTGGRGSGGILDSAEIFDPVTRAWADAGALEFRRTGHSATLLPSGRVLVAGGNGTAPRATAETYDPATGSWTLAGSLNVARTGHAATLLRSGRVLVSGGTGSGGGALDSTEVYDPAVDGWTAVEPLAAARSGHRLLPTISGQVLAVGGAEEAELFGPPASLLERPQILAAPSTIAFGAPFEVSGNFFDGSSEAGDGTRQGSAVNYPLLQLQAVENGALVALRPDPRSGVAGDPVTLTVSELPDSLQPGWHYLTVITAGVGSWSKLVRLECSLAVTRQPESQVVPLGAAATFSVEAQGERTVHWRRNGEDIPGATGPS